MYEEISNASDEQFPIYLIKQYTKKNFCLQRFKLDSEKNEGQFSRLKKNR